MIVSINAKGENQMKYFVDYQYMPKGAARPADDGEVVGIEATDKSGVVILPNVGDYVQIDNSIGGDKRSSFDGKVQSRLFRYIGAGDTGVEPSCLVNIVVAETNDDWGKLVKE